MTISTKASRADVATWVEATARHIPGKPAVLSSRRVLTYRELVSEASAIVHALREAGAAPGRVVGVALPVGPDLVAGLLGVLAAGGAYLVVDQADPVARTRGILTDAAAAAMIGPFDVCGRLAPHVPAVDPTELRGADPSADDKSVDSGPTARLAYIYYTSGSTGVPKGAGMPMGPLINLLAWELDRMRQRETAHTASPGLGRQKKVLHFTRPTFDVSFQEIFATLVAGDCLVTAEEERRRNPQYLIELMHEHGVERAYIPPMVLSQLASSGLGTGARLKLWELVVAGGSLRLT
jgi:non-ribosomal peptide synthetase component F